MIKIQRKVYDENGTETVLGLPCKTVTDYWNGEIAGSKMSIEDAFNIETIDITDYHSTDVIDLLSTILNIKQLERLVPTNLSLQKGYLGPVILQSGEIYFNKLLNDSIKKVNIGDLTLEGIPVIEAYKCNGDTSYCYIENTAINLLLDNKTSIDNYSLESASDLVYGIIPKEYIVQNEQLTDWAKKILPYGANPANCNLVTNDDGTVTNTGGNMYDSDGNSFITITSGGVCNASVNLPNEPCYNILFYTSKNYMDKMIGVCSIAVGINNQGLLPWIINAHNSFGIPISVLTEESDIIYEGYPTYNLTASSTGATTYQTSGTTNTYIDNWYNLSYDEYRSWTTTQLGASIFGQKCLFFLKYFKPTSLPTGIKMYVDDKIWIYINGKEVLIKGGCPNTTVTMDFSPYINLNEVNNLCVLIDNGYSEGSGRGYGYFGFV